MEDPVTDACLVNMPPLRVTDIKTYVWPVNISLFRKFSVQLKNVVFEMEFKKRNLTFLAFSSFKLVPRREQICYTYYIMKNTTMMPPPPATPVILRSFMV